MTHRTEDENAFSTTEVARRLGVSIPTIQRWVDAGYLRAWKTPGGHRRIDAASAEAMRLAQQRTIPATEVSAVVVDDNPDDRDLLQAIVQEALPGAGVACFDNAIDALVAIGRHAPQLVITDIVMPHMDGLEMVRRLAALTSLPPPMLVVVSATMPAGRARTSGLPQEAIFLPKPLDAREMVTLLRGVRMRLPSGPAG